MNLEEKTVAELRDLAREEEITGYSKMTKAELVSILEPNVDDTDEKINEMIERYVEPVSNEKELHKKVNEEKTVKNWLKVFNDNYEGKSKEAKDLEKYTKETYQGAVYVPWAVMERMIYQQDPEANFYILRNKDGGIVHTDSLINEQFNTQKGETISHTKSTMFSHTVEVGVEFLGKIVVDTYPIQDKDYDAARIYNQNLVNRALQRAKARAAARVSGLALKLYEGHELQFDFKEEKTIPTVTSETIVPVEAPKVEAPKVKEAPVIAEVKEEPKAEVKIEGPIGETIALLRNNDPEIVNSVLQRVNPSILSKFKFTLALTDTDEELAEKVAKFLDPEKFKKSLENMLGV